MIFLHVLAGKHASMSNKITKSWWGSMEYILISIMTISVFTYIVYILANKLLAVQMHLKYLILCACCALVISLILPRFLIGFAGLTGTLGIVIIFAIISSYFITYYYDDAMQKVTLENTATTNTIDTAEIPLMPNLNYSLQISNAEVKLEKIVEIDEKVEVCNDLMNLEQQKDSLNTSLMSEAIQEYQETSSSNDLSDSYPSSSDLDVLMDFAFLQKEQRHFLQAVKAFRQALTLYPDSEVGPFLVMEIGTILKTIGSYDEAIKVFSEGRLLPGVINNSMLEQEFINNIAYLRVIKNILVKNSLEFMPFNLIPENAFKEINDEFCEWRNQS